MKKKHIIGKLTFENNVDISFCWVGNRFEIISIF